MTQRAISAMINCNLMNHYAVMEVNSNQFKTCIEFY